MFRTKNTSFNKNHADDNGLNLKKHIGDNGLNLKTIRMGLGALRLKWLKNGLKKYLKNRFLCLVDVLRDYE